MAEKRKRAGVTVEGVPKKRDRFQVVVHLGEKSRGAEARRALERAASLLHQELGAWCRRVLLAAAGMHDQQFVTLSDLEKLQREWKASLESLQARVEKLEEADAPSRADMEKLIQRLEAVEEHAGIDPFPVLDPGERSRRDRSR